MAKMPGMRKKRAAEIAAWLSEAQGYRATFHEVVERARASGKVDQEFVDRLDQQFNDLEKQMTSADDPGDEVLESLCERAEELERLRAYVFPDHEILLQARTCIEDLRDWGVPRATLHSIERDLIPSMEEKNQTSTKRAALHNLFEYYDAWEAHVTNFDEWVRVRAQWLGGILAVALAGSVAAVLTGYGLAAFLAAGVAGSIASVLSRLPPMVGWGSWAALPARIYSRVGLGIAGTLAGGGLMANGIFTIGKDAAGFSTILSTDHQATIGEGLYLAAIGILLGFSERLLSSLAGSFVKVPATTPDTEELPPVKGEV
jgi:hypothetical protein